MPETRISPKPFKVCEPSAELAARSVEVEGRSLPTTPYSFNRSAALYARAQRSIADGVNSGIRKMEAPVPLYFSHGQGSRLIDVDGNEYLDFQLGQGVLLYGHAPW